MIASRSSFNEVVKQLVLEERLALDTETTGLRPYHGDRLFSIIITSRHQRVYFNFQFAPDIPNEDVLTKQHFSYLQKELFALPTIEWDMHNAVYDLHMCGMDKLEFDGPVFCTKINGRVEYNMHTDYSLDASLTRIGLKKDDAVKKYVQEHNLKTKIPIPGKNTELELQHYDKVPFSIIVPYGLDDGSGTFALGTYLRDSVATKDAESPPGREMRNVIENECRLTKTIWRMEKIGVKGDKTFCERAIAHENERMAKAALKFQHETGCEYKQSPKLFAEVFKNEKPKWFYTEKGNPSFDSDALALLESPAATAILELRDAKAKSDFYHGFLFHSDPHGIVHPHFNSGGTVHGRFSSSEPNFQNLTSEDDVETLAGDFVVRRAIVPRPGFIFFMPDYSAMEYRFALEMACRMIKKESPLAVLVNGGMDFHTATVEVCKAVGVEITRGQAKTVNFLSLYGGGVPKLAAGLKCTVSQAQKIQNAVNQAAPEILSYKNEVKRAAETKGYIVNWLGRRCYFPNRRMAYKAPNYHVSGGCADVLKVAMNRIDELLLPLKSRMVLTIHDELVIEVHETEKYFVPQFCQHIMETAFTSKYVPLVTTGEWSARSLADKEKGFPT